MVKKKMTNVLAIALVLCLLAGAALAATLMYSSRYAQADRADALLREQYGITEDKRSFFTRTSEGSVYTYTGLEGFQGMLGVYRVDVSAGTVEWLFGGTQGTGWDAAKMDEVLSRCQQPDGYAEVVQEAKAAAEACGLVVSQRVFNVQEANATAAQTADRVAQAEKLAKLTMTEAEALGRAAIRERYQLTDEQMKDLTFVPESSMFLMEGEFPAAEPYFWLTQQEGTFTEKDGIYIVVVNALDGAIEDIVYDSGLLGNG